MTPLKNFFSSIHVHIVQSFISTVGYNWVYFSFKNKNVWIYKRFFVCLNLLDTHVRPTRPQMHKGPLLYSSMD